MKLEKLDYWKRKKNKWILCGLFAGLFLLIVVGLLTSKAKYKQVDNVELIRQNITYSVPDLNIVSVYVKDERGIYQEQNEIPQTDAVLDKDESYCTISSSNDKINDILEYQDGKLIVDITQRDTKCYLYFKQLLSEKTLKKLGLTSFLLGNKGNKFAGPSCSYTEYNCGSASGTFYPVDNTQDGGLYEFEDDFGISYYFRGGETIFLTPIDNWVKLGETYWRIIRINGNGTIRLIYNGTTTDQYVYDPYTQIVAEFNQNGDDNAYVGFKYGTTGASKYEETHKNRYESNALIELKKFYNENLLEYASYLDGYTGFCGDRRVTLLDLYGNQQIGDGTGEKTTVYGPFTAIMDEETQDSKSALEPVFTCKNKANDLYTTSSEKGIGNGALSVPVGLITMDEVIFAGGYLNAVNETGWLNNRTNFWTMSPAFYDNESGGAFMFFASATGALFINSVTASSNAEGPMTIRPVINLRANTSFKFTNNGKQGSVENPFVVDLDPKHIPTPPGKESS